MTTAVSISTPKSTVTRAPAGRPARPLSLQRKLGGVSKGGRGCPSFALFATFRTTPKHRYDALEQLYADAKPPHPRADPAPSAKLKERRNETADTASRPNTKRKAKRKTRDHRIQETTETDKNEITEDAVDTRCATKPRKAGPIPLPEAPCTKGGLPTRPREHASLHKRKLQMRLKSDLLGPNPRFLVRGGNFTARPLDVHSGN